VVAGYEDDTEGAQKRFRFVLLPNGLDFMEEVQCSDFQWRHDAGLSTGAADLGGGGCLVQGGVQTPCRPVGGFLNCSLPETPVWVQICFQI